MSVGGSLRYELRGPGAAPVVVLSGSLGTDLSMWDPQVAQLSTRLRVLRYDLRGHGSSPVPDGPYSIADLGRDLLALLERLQIERAALCGLSIGGMLSMWAAAHAPERVMKLVVCCTAANLGDEARERYTKRAVAVRERGIEPIADEVVARWFTPGFARAQPAVVERFRRMLVSTPPEGYASCCEALAAMDMRPELQSIAAPTLVLAGAEDAALPPEHGRQIAAGIDSARLTIVSQAAHLATVERAEEITGLVQSFLTEEDTP